MTIAPLPTGFGVRTRLVDDPGRLIDLLPDDRSPLSWVRGADGLVGWGEVARFTAKGPDRFAQADEWWRTFSARLDVRDEVGIPGTGPVAFASFAFSDTSPGSVMVVPRVLVGRRDGRAWITEFSHGDGPSAVRAVSPVRPSGPLRYADGVLPVPRYRAAVREAVRRMQTGGLGKAVLAHDLMAIGDEPLDPRFLLDGLARRYPTCWSFAVDGLVGATPELLMRRIGGSVVQSRVLAGTIWPGEGGPRRPGGRGCSAPARTATSTRWPSTRWPRRCARSATHSTCPETPAVIALHNVSHLASDVARHPATPTTPPRCCGSPRPCTRPPPSAAPPATRPSP